MLRLLANKASSVARDNFLIQFLLLYVYQTPTYLIFLLSTPLVSAIDQSTPVSVSYRTESFSPLARLFFRLSLSGFFAGETAGVGSGDDGKRTGSGRDKPGPGLRAPSPVSHLRSKSAVRVSGLILPFCVFMQFTGLHFY